MTGQHTIKSQRHKIGHSTDRKNGVKMAYDARSSSQWCRGAATHVVFESGGMEALEGLEAPQGALAQKEGEKERRGKRSHFNAPDE